MAGQKRYVVVGTGGRASMYISAIAGEFSDVAELKAFCDSNQTRMDYWNGFLQKEHSHPAAPTHKPEAFDRMIADQKPDAVIVTSIDRTHHCYICRAMELGCDVVSEKPMTIDAERCQRIVDTVRRTGKNLTVTFNYRYAPRNTKVKEVLRSGAVRNITSVHFEWLLDTSHGADYFRRWHRNKANSGGLLVHKSTHHFDLMNWWLDSAPETVFAMGGLRFYGKENAELRGVREFYYRSRGSDVARKDPFALKVKPTDERVMGLYYAAEHEDHYYRDQSVFGDGIDIEDNLSVVVRYASKAVMTYSLCAHCPWEGYRVCFNGTQGRLEFNVVETAFVDGRGEDFSEFGAREMDGDRTALVPEILFHPHWGKPRVIEYDASDKSGHGGGDAKLLAHVFRGVKSDPLGHAAGYVDGARSILTGIAGNQSMRTGLPVRVADLVRFPED